ncbi:MAG: nucleoside monophosphate kinase [Planctomycetota bacterium]|jgi:adenylate kinase|nr:MAG: nucleoside monophosphate kinase [Planctomycetota bacterium]
MSHRYKCILLFGSPGSGKGTQGKILGEIPGFFHLACGDVFRSLDLTSPLGKKFMTHSSKGELVPDELTVEMWQNNMKAQVSLSIFKPAQDLLVLDGIPRTVSQAKALKDYLDVLAVLHLVCPDEAEMVRRMRRRALKENRLDDADEKVIRHRFEVYRKETEPVLSYYPKEIIHEVSAIASPSMVLMSVLDTVAPIQDHHFRNPLAT